MLVQLGHLTIGEIGEDGHVRRLHGTQARGLWPPSHHHQPTLAAGERADDHIDVLIGQQSRHAQVVAIIARASDTGDGLEIVGL